jgi:hypothetical protein
VPQIVVYSLSHRGIREAIAHWLRPDGKTFCGRDPKRSVGWSAFPFATAQAVTQRSLGG